MDNNSIGVFDSGLGGLTTLYECKKLLPNESFIYLADSLNIPYGTKSDDQIKARVFACTKALFSRRVKAVVVACNTATNAGIKDLRNMYPCQFVGLEPALKPACEAFDDRNILLLCTEATANGQKLAQLKEKLNQKNIIVSPQKQLAEQIENCINKNLEATKQSTEKIFELYEKNELFCLNTLRPEIERILYPYKKNIGSVVLGCTHYVFIKDIIQEALGNGVKIFDGNVGAAKRLEYLLNANSQLTSLKGEGKIEFLVPLPKKN